MDAYTLVFAGLLLTAGSLSDRYGRRTALAAGLVIFGVGSLASAFAGIGEHADLHPRAHGGGRCVHHAVDALDPDERLPGRGAGTRDRHLGRCVRARNRIGPVVGGWLLTHFWWGSVFLVNVPVVIFALIAGRLIVPNSKDPSAPRLDPVGASLSIVGLVSLVFGIIEAPSHGWTDPSILTALGSP